MTGRDRVTIGAVAFALTVIVLAFIHPALPHDHKKPHLNDWMKSLYSKGNTWCCDGNDNDAIDSWEMKEGRYRVKFQGRWFDVPDGALVSGPNMGGDALLWMNTKGWGPPSVRCFMPGSMS